MQITQLAWSPDLESLTSLTTIPGGGGALPNPPIYCSFCRQERRHHYDEIHGVLCDNASICQFADCERTDHQEAYLGVSFQLCRYCDSCSDHCGCVVCHNCDNDVETVCPKCEYCEDCCDGHEAESRLDLRNLKTCNYPLHLYIDTRAARYELDNRTNRTDPATEMATFYLLEYMMAHAPSASASEAAIIDIAHQSQQAQVADLDTTFRLYLRWIIGGELRHHSLMPITSGRSAGGSRFFDLCQLHGTCVMLTEAVAMFDDSGWECDDYGGPQWSRIAQILQLRECGRIDPKTFTDRVFSLQHNSGTLFDKRHWANFNLAHHQSLHLMTIRIGVAHSCNPTDVWTLLQYADPSARGLYRQWHIAHNGSLRERGLPLRLYPVRTPRPARSLRNSLLPGQ